MSGLATAAAVTSAVAGIGSTVYSVVNGQQQASAQTAALKKQTTAQQTAQGQALSTERQSAIAQDAANQQTPDISSILKKAATTGTGLSSTMLTGPTGVDSSSLSLGGGSTLLGK